MAAKFKHRIAAKRATPWTGGESNRVVRADQEEDALDHHWTDWTIASSSSLRMYIIMKSIDLQQKREREREEKWMPLVFFLSFIRFLLMCGGCLSLPIVVAQWTLYYIRRRRWRSLFERSARNTRRLPLHIVNILYMPTLCNPYIRVCSFRLLVLLQSDHTKASHHYRVTQQHITTWLLLLLLLFSIITVSSQQSLLSLTKSKKRRLSLI